jgi:ADP-L-glycero-D-manno-heptose 6-epimerase
MFIITGATGFIGSALVWELNQHGISDLVLSDHIPPSDRPDLLKKRRYKDFIPAAQLHEFLKTAQDVQAVFHMGACSTTTETDEDYLRRNNLEYSQNIFRWCTARRVPLIYASSGAVYGDGKKGFDDSTDPNEFIPLNLYGWSKLKMDIWALQQTQTPPHWYGLRFFNVYGPNEYHKGDMASVPFKAFRQISENGKLRLFKSHVDQYKDGEQLRDFVYVKDITRWMREMLENPQVQSGIYNMGFGQARTWLDLAKNVFLGMKKTMQIDWIEIPPNIRNQYQYFTEAKMDRLLGQKLSNPQWPLEKGIQDYVVNYLGQKDPYL